MPGSIINNNIKQIMNLISTDALNGRLKAAKKFKPFKVETA